MSLRYVHKITEKVKVHGKDAVLLKPNKTSTNKYQICNFTSSRSNQICTEKKKQSRYRTIKYEYHQSNFAQ